MAKEGLKWNAEKKKVEKIRWRAERANDYYWIDSIGRIMADTEIKCQTDNNRYRYGNYFKTQKEAEINNTENKEKQESAEKKEYTKTIYIYDEREYPGEEGMSDEEMQELLGSFYKEIEDAETSEEIKDGVRYVTFEKQAGKLGL